MDYEYSRAEKLAAHRPYDFSAFHGREFLDAYFRDRESCLSLLGDPRPASATAALAHLARLSPLPAPPDLAAIARGAAPVPTVPLLLGLLGLRHRSAPWSADAEFCLQRLLRKIEVRHFLADRYPAGFGAAAVPAGIGPHALGSLLLGVELQQEGDRGRRVAILNALLKLNDRISCHRDELRDAADIAAAAGGLAAEMSLVREYLP